VEDFDHPLSTPVGTSGILFGGFLGQYHWGSIPTEPELSGTHTIASAGPGMARLFPVRRF